MATAAHRSRECGHTGQGFSYLWGALGANVGGPEATAAFFKEASWHFDLVRRCDGSFTYDGGEQFGAGMTDDDIDMDCATCHDPHVYPPGAHRLRGTKEPGAFCVRCHKF